MPAAKTSPTKRLWRHALRNARCLMPALGWYDWSEKETLRNPAGRHIHQSYFIHSPTDPIIAIAGLWSLWIKPNGEPVLSCALLTRSAAPSLEHIHHRMLVVLARENFGEWLSTATCSEAKGDLIHQAREDFAGYRVSLRVSVNSSA